MENPLVLKKDLSTLTLSLSTKYPLPFLFIAVHWKRTTAGIKGGFNDFLFLASFVPCLRSEFSTKAVALYSFLSAPAAQVVNHVCAANLTQRTERDDALQRLRMEMGESRTNAGAECYHHGCRCCIPFRPPRSVWDHLTFSGETKKDATLRLHSLRRYDKKFCFAKAKIKI